MSNTLMNEPPQSIGYKSIKELWDEVAEEFFKICGESLDRGEIHSFQDLQDKIEQTQIADRSIDEAQKTTRIKIKEVGLMALKGLEILVDAATQASSLAPLPPGAANLSRNALFLVFNITEKIRAYEDTISAVFTELAPAFSQLKMYESMAKMDDDRLLRQIHLLMFSFVKICAHVVKFRQGNFRKRFVQKLKTIVDDDSGLRKEMAEFKRLLQALRDVEGTKTLSVGLEVKQDTMKLVETSKDIDENTRYTRQVIQSQTEQSDLRNKLRGIREALGLPQKMQLNTSTTETFGKILGSCSTGTGEWIQKHEAYIAWTEAKRKVSANSNPYVLLLSGPSGSGKTLATARIVEHLETLNPEKRSTRELVAHRFFPASDRKSKDKTLVHFALKRMAFQLARMDAAVRKDLGSACEPSGSVPALKGSSLDIKSLWKKLKIGKTSSDTTYYLVFDGLENLGGEQAHMLLNFALDPEVTGDLGRVRILLSGTDDEFRDNNEKVQGALRIKLQLHNEQDLRIIVREKLQDQHVLDDAMSETQQKIRDKVIDRLPKKAQGSYTALESRFDQLVDLLNSRATMKQLDQLLDWDEEKSHEVVIESLQQSLTSEEIGDLNELLKWVVFGCRWLTLSDLEAVMSMHRGTESLVSLQHIIAQKYSAIFKVDDNRVYQQQDGIADYLSKKQTNLELPREGQASISMTIAIKDADQEVCGHFFWDLAQKAIREKFKFEMDANSNTFGKTRAIITLDEFEAHHTIVTTALSYLSQSRVEPINNIGRYLACHLPTHLVALSNLERDDKRRLEPNERLVIVQSLYDILKNNEVFVRHRECFEVPDGYHWTVIEMRCMQRWLMDSSITPDLDEVWKRMIEREPSPPKGLLKPFVKTVVDWFLRGRHRSVVSAYRWVEVFIQSDNDSRPQLSEAKSDEAETDEAKSDEAEPDEASSRSSESSTENYEIDWDKTSNWCRDFMGLSDTDLDSLWYERLADAALELDQQSEVTEKLYKRALEKENPSWMCHHSFSKALYKNEQTQEAIAQVQLALQKINFANPEAERMDMLDLTMELADMMYITDDFENAAKHYADVRDSSEDKNQAIRGEVGLVKAKLSFLDEEETKRLLHDIVPPGGPNQQQHFVSLIKKAAGDADRDFILLRILDVAKADPRLLGDVVRALDTATIDRRSDDDKDASTMQTFAEDRGILLYYRGIAAYTYKVAPKGTDPVSGALELWNECRAQLADGGDTAFYWRWRATEEMAKHYFQTISRQDMDECKLVKLKGLDDTGEGDSSPVRGFLGSLYALHGEKEQSKAVLRPYVRSALDILSDDDPDNDSCGLLMLHDALGQHQDFQNLAVAISLIGNQDIVTRELNLVVEKVNKDAGVDNPEVRDLVTELVAKTVKSVKSQVPEPAQQVERIMAATAHINLLLAAHKKMDNADMDICAGAGAEAEVNTGTDTRRLALDYLQDLPAKLEQYDTPQKLSAANVAMWSCYGRKSNGKACRNTDLDSDFYHCIYCYQTDLCADCLGRLRGITPEGGSSLSPSLSTSIIICSAKHRWFKIPAAYSDIYVGPAAATVMRPKDIKPIPGDESILEACYDTVNTEQIEVSAWKTELARDWGFCQDEDNIQEVIWDNSGGADSVHTAATSAGDC